MRQLLVLLFCMGITSLLPAQVLLEEDFENGWPGWDMINVDMLTPDDPDLITMADSAWTPRYITQAGAESTGAFSVSWYQNDEGPSDDWMILPAITVENNTILSWTGMAITSSGNYRDRYQVAISTAGPVLDDFYDNPLLFDTECEGEDVVPTMRMVNLSEAGYTGETVHIAFRNFTEPYEDGEPIGPDLCNGGNELYIDDIRIEANVSSIDRIAAAQLQLRAFPNPAADFTQMAFVLPEAAEVRVRVSDLFGRVVTEFDAGHLPAGEHQIPVPVADLPAGMYMLNLLTDTFTSSLSLQKL